MKKIILKIAVLAALALSVCAPVQAGVNLLANSGFVPDSPGTACDAYKVYGSIDPPSWTFESVLIDGVTRFKNGPLPNTIYLNDCVDPSPNPVPPFEGSLYFLDLGGYGTPDPEIGDYVQQTFNTVAGHKYKLTFGFSSEANGTPPGTPTTSESGKDSMQVDVGDQSQVFDSPYQAGYPNYGLHNVPLGAGGAFQMPWARREVIFTATASSTTLKFSVADVSMNNYEGTDAQGNPYSYQLPNSANSVMIAMPEVVELSSTLTINKISLGGVGEFKFKGTAANNNGFSTDDSYAVTTTTAGTAAAGTTVILTTSNTLTEIQEVVPAGWILNNATCVDANATSNGNTTGIFGSISGTTLTIPALNMVPGSDIQCTFTNTSTGFSLSGKVLTDTGVGSGTAHDGIQNGSEPGHSGVILSLTNCTATPSKVYSTTTSSGDGSFSLSLSGVPIGAAACLVESLPNAYSAVSVKVGTTVGSYTSTTTTLQFTPAASTDYSGIVLGDAPVSTFVSDGALQTSAGQSVVYAHVYVAGSAGSVSFSSTGNPIPPVLDWTSVLYKDRDCNGTLEGAVDSVLTTAPVSVLAGETVCILEKVTSPPNSANGAQDITTVKAIETWAVSTFTPPTLTHTLTNIDTTTVSAGGLSLLKDVRRVALCPANAAASLADTADVYASSGSAKPGDFLEYRLRYGNNTATPLTGIKLFDTVPSFTQFRSALCLALPSRGIASCAVVNPPAVGSINTALEWKIADAASASIGLQPQDSGSVSFCVQVQSN